MMRRPLIFVICFCFSLIFVSGIAAQTEIVSQDFQKLWNGAQEQLAKRPHRKRSLMKTYPDQKTMIPLEIRDITTERIPPDREHSVYEITESNKTRRSEIIRIGSVRYDKNDDGSWRQTTENRLSGSGSGSSNVTYFYLGTEVRNGKTVRLYQAIYRIALRSPPGERKFSVTTNSYTFSEDGLLLFELRENHDGLLTKPNVYSVEYVYDPNIKIEAPIK